MAPQLKHVAIVGATGTVGSYIFKHLLSTFQKVTIVTRPESKIETPQDAKLTVARVDSTDHEGLMKAFTGVDALVITQAMTAPTTAQIAYIDAAVEAGVGWIVPNEYGLDNDREELYKQIPVMAVKHAASKRVEEKAKELGKSTKWIGVVNGLWYDWSLAVGFLGINAKERTATLFGDGKQPTISTTLEQIGLAVARLFSLPATKVAGQPSLADYSNKFLYVSSFRVSQAEMLASVQRVTGTAPSDWNVSYIPVDDAVKVGTEARDRGEFHPYLIYANAFKPGIGGLYEGRELANKALGLPQEDLDAATKQGLDSAYNLG